MRPESIPSVGEAHAKRANSLAKAMSSIMPSGVTPLTAAINQVLVGAAMGYQWRLARLQLEHDHVDKHLTQFDTPLIKRVDIPDRPHWED